MNTDSRLRIVWLMIAAAFAYLGIIAVIEGRDAKRVSSSKGSETSPAEAIEGDEKSSTSKGPDRDEPAPLPLTRDEALALAERFPDSWISRVEDRGGSIIRVMTPDSKRGVAGAKVITHEISQNAITAFSTTLTPWESLDFSEDFEGLNDGSARTYFTDARGFCSLPVALGRLVFRIDSSEGFYPATPGVSAGYIEAEHPVISLPLHPLVSPLRCRVLDSRRRPVRGIDVVLKAPAENNPQVHENVATVKTDPDGIAEVQAIDLDANVVGKFELALFDPLHCLPEVSLAAGSELGGDLRLPPCGRLRLDLMLPDGNPFDGDITLQVTASTKSSSPRFIRRVSRGSLCELDHIPFDHRLTLSGYAGDGRYRLSKIQLTGPTRERPLVEKVLRVEEAQATISMQLVQAPDRPVANRPVVLRVISDQFGDFSLELDRTTSDEKGSCEFVLAAPIDSEFPESRIEVVVLGSDETTPAESKAATLGTTLRLAHGKHNGLNTHFGTVTLDTIPPTLKGKIVDDRGYPIAGVRVLPLVSKDEVAVISSLHILPPWTHSDERGRFEIRTAGKTRPRNLLLKKPGFPSEVAVVSENHDRASGAGPAAAPRIVMPRSGHVELSFKPALECRQNYRVVLTGFPAAFYPLSPDPAPRRVGTWTSPKRVVWSSLRSGSATIEIYGPADPDLPLLTIPQVKVRAGEITDDPRLRDIDLREGNWVRDIIISDRKGAGLPDVQVEVATGDGFRRLGVSDSRGAFRLLAAEALTQLRFVKHGYQAREIISLGNQVEITMKPAPRLRLEFARDFPMPKPPQFLIVRPQETRDDDWNDLTESWIVGDDGSCLVRLWRPGLYRFYFSLRFQIAGYADPQVGLPRPVETLEFEVHDVQDLQTRRIYPNRRRFTESLQQAKERR